MKINILNQAQAAFDPERYILDEGLRNAVEVAIALNQPLLLTGEPGTGKTKLAWKVAHELSKDKQTYQFVNRPLVFNTKTASASRDLFYLYDALGHFQAANIKRDAGQQAPQTADFIELQALGRAIAMTNPTGIDPGKFKTDLPAKAQSAVVLIDEVDKAPRDFPNDLLNEIENQEFQIKELDNYTVQRGNEQRIVIVLTSNSEKNLPDAFLRRCVFYHIPFPSDQQLLQIAKAQLGDATAYTDKLLEDLIARFVMIRQRAVRKPPATAELIAWLRILELNRIFDMPDTDKQKQMRDNLLILVKTKEDLDAVKGLL